MSNRNLTFVIELNDTPSVQAILNRGEETEEIIVQRRYHRPGKALILDDAFRLIKKIADEQSITDLTPVPARTRQRKLSHKEAARITPLIGDNRSSLSEECRREFLQEARKEVEQQDPLDPERGYNCIP